MIFYISDTHFFHENIIRMCNRPFQGVEEMNKTLVDRWNARVTDEDDVYILGDIFFKAPSVQACYEILEQLKGKKHLIKGNHDKYTKDIKFCSYFESIDLYKEINDNERMVVLFHYPIEEWNGFFRPNNVYHLYGHVHDKTHPHLFHRYNVSADVIDFEPKTLDELKALNNEIYDRELNKELDKEMGHSTFRWVECLRRLEAGELRKDKAYIISFPIEQLHMLFEMSSKLIDYRAIFECTTRVDEIIVQEIDE